MWSVLVLLFPLPLHFSLRWYLVRWRWGWRGCVDPPGDLWTLSAVPWSSCPGPSPGLEVAGGGVPPSSQPLKTLAGGIPVVLVKLRHAWWGSWRAPLRFGSCRHVSPLGLCHVLRPAHSLAGWSPAVSAVTPPSQALQRPSAHPLPQITSIPHPPRQDFLGLLETEVRWKLNAGSCSVCLCCSRVDFADWPWFGGLACEAVLPQNPKQEAERSPHPHTCQGGEVGTRLPTSFPASCSLLSHFPLYQASLLPHPVRSELPFFSPLDCVMWLVGA